MTKASLFCVIAAMAAIAGFALMRPIPPRTGRDSGPTTEVFVIDNSDSMYSCRKQAIQAVGNLVDAGCPDTHVIIYAFAGQRDVAHLEKLYDGIPSQAGDVYDAVIQALPPKSPHHRGTGYSIALNQIIALVRRAPGPVRVVVASDGGVDTGDIPAAAKASAQLAALPHLCGVFVVPVTNGVWRQLLETEALAPLGDRLVIGGASDAEDALDRFLELKEKGR